MSKIIIITGRCEVEFKKTIVFRDGEEAIEFINDCIEDNDLACCQIDESDIEKITQIDEVNVALQPNL